MDGYKNIVVTGTTGSGKSTLAYRRKLAALIENPGGYAHMRILHFTTPHKAQQWLDTLT